MAMVVAAGLWMPAGAQALEVNTYFPYPTPPDTMQLFSQRADFFVTHFWDRCELKKAFSSREKMRVALEDFIQMLPNATDTVALDAVNRLMTALNKQPDDQAFFANEAEAQLYSDTAQYLSDKLYVAFAKPFIANKKAKKELKLRHERLVKILDGTRNGIKPPALDYETREGEKGSTANDFGQLVIYFFNDPDCGDCAITRARLMADIKVRQLLESGALKIVSIYPDAASDEWRDKVKDYPESWRVVAAEDANDIYDLRMLPTFYIIYRGKIWGKGLNIDQVIGVVNRL